MAVEVAVWVRAASKASKTLGILSIKSDTVFQLKF